MELKTTFSHYFPENSTGGQCAVFAEKLEQFGPVGDTLASKTAYVKKHGILRENLGGHYEVGDVVVTNESSKFGHVFIVNDIVGNQLQATESNFKLDLRVHHTRIVPVSSKIVGVLRGCPLKVAIINPQISKTFMKITLVANNNTWTTLQTQLDTLKQWFINYSGNKFEPVFDIKQTSFTNIPFEQLPSFPTKSVQVNWYRSNITPLATGQATLLLLNQADWHADGSFGNMTWGDPGKPIRIECYAAESEPLKPDGWFAPRAFHEMCHALFFLTGQSDRVHEFLYQDPPKNKELLDLVDWKKVQDKLVTIKP